MALAKASGASWGRLWANAAGDDLVRIFTGELFGVGARLRVRRAVGVAFHRDRRHGNYWSLGEAFFEFVVLGFAVRQAEPPAIIMNHDGNVIGIAEGRRAAVEGGVIEIPLG